MQDTHWVRKRDEMKISDAFPSKYLKAADLPDGRDVRVQVQDVRLETLEQSGDEKPVCYFIGKTRGLVLNSTNATAISAVLGDETESWHGQTIILFSATTTFGGKTVPCIRVRVPRTSPPPAPQPAPMDPPADDFGAGEIPF